MATSMRTSSLLLVPLVALLIACQMSAEEQESPGNQEEPSLRGGPTAGLGTVPVSTPPPTPTPPPASTPLPSPTSTNLSQHALLGSLSVPVPKIVGVIAETGSNAVLVRFSEVVHLRGDVWLDTSSGPTANTDVGGSKTLVFGAGDLTGSVEVQGIGYGPGAAVRDIRGNDAETGFPSMGWIIGDERIAWDTDVDSSSPSAVEGITVDGEYWRVSFTKPVYVVGDVRLETSSGGEELVERPNRASGSRFLLFHDAPSRAHYSSPITVEAFRFDEPQYAVRDLDGRDAMLDFAPMRWVGFPRPRVQTMADCVYDAYSDEYSIDSIRRDTILNTDSDELTDARRFEWYRFLSSHSNDLMAACVTLWSEEVTESNADKRNELYAVDCLAFVNRNRPMPQALADDTLALLERPYLSLAAVERLVLRGALRDGSNCELYYPQLFSGRWIPFPEYP
ncbi:MAG: hypothetical protein J4F43_08945 [Dehalococcoidia bacterium]|nr:hypothetical protein [Dehalococcoidia bacterium]